MFTGIIKALGKVKQINKKAENLMFLVESPHLTDVKEGDSIAVNGVCLTCTSYKDGNLYFDIMEHTVVNTNISFLKIGDIVNLEPALKLSDPLGGHLVSGHVDGIGIVSEILQNNRLYTIRFSCSPHLTEMMILKGSIAVNGVSLTIIELAKEWFKCSFVPYTLENTNIKFLRIGDKVNIETDLIGKWIKKILNSKNTPLPINYEAVL